jgi:hypothetical protein
MRDWPIFACLTNHRYSHRRKTEMRRESKPVQQEENVQVGVVMGSASDWEVMRHAVEPLENLGIPHEARVVSAHRTPDLLYEYAKSAAARACRGRDARRVPRLARGNPRIAHRAGAPALRPAPWSTSSSSSFIG